MYNEYITILHNLFEHTFMETYRGLKSKTRREILPYLQAVHRRWYYSTLIENTPLTPANLMDSIAAYCKEPLDRYPVVTLRTPSRVKGIDMKMLSYTVENHPVVEDMRRIIEFCTPNIDLDDDGFFTDEQSIETAKLLSIDDPYYASFLLETAISMKLLTKVCALHIYRMSPNKKTAEFFEQSNEEIFRAIVNKAIEMSSTGIHAVAPIPDGIFTESFIRKLLTQPMSTDEIFGIVFDVMGCNFEDLTSYEDLDLFEEMSSEHFEIGMEVLSCTFILGILLDRFFFTTFGNFLRIIRPMYSLQFELEEEVSEFTRFKDDQDETADAFFAPCSSYTLTDLGLKLFNIKPDRSNYFDAARNINFENMKDSVFSCKEALQIFVSIARQMSPVMANMEMYPDNVYVFRVQAETDKTMWIHLQLPDNITLDEVYDEIAECFALKNNGEYSFFHDKTENRFAEYPSEKRAAKIKHAKIKAEECYINSLDFDHMKNMLLAAYAQAPPFTDDPPIIRLQLERIKVKEAAFEDSSPKIIRMSKSMKLLNEG